MKITLKLYATLGERLPPGAYENAAQIDVAPDVTLNDIIDRYKVPRELAHLVLINGLFTCEEDRDRPGTLSEGDTLAIWPPVAGG
ncbi:MAG: MoaD/ThiS family protein [Gammaproteobacteria bacterium]|nr:MoaD/ThiS family protein [Gammaproteobacteria bacterium]